MAINKIIELPTGVFVSYWKISTILFNRISNESRVRLVGYKDQTARIAGKEPTVVDYFNWNGDDNPFSVEDMDVNNPIILAYNKIKQTEKFSDAENV